MNLTLFGRPEVINHSVTTLREYKCPGCGGSINVLEGGKCSFCGNTFDYSEFGWVIEAYESTRKRISLYQFIKYGMIGIFVLVFGFHILFPSGIHQRNIFQLYGGITQVMEELDDFLKDVQHPEELYEGVTLVSENDYLIERRYEYEALDADKLWKDYYGYLKETGFEVYEESEHSYTLYKITWFLDKSDNPEPSYYRIIVTKENTRITILEAFVSDLEEVVE